MHTQRPLVGRTRIAVEPWLSMGSRGLAGLAFFVPNALALGSFVH
jgi:hypothetical protein